MTEHSLWRFSRALYRAINERQREDLEPLIDDDVEWVIHGPIMFPFLGARRGKAAVLEVIRQVAENVRVHRFDRESIMLGVDSAAAMIPRRLVGRGCQLLLAAGLSLVAVLQAHAQTVPAGKNPDVAETAAPD